MPHTKVLGHLNQLFHRLLRVRPLCGLVATQLLELNSAMPAVAFALNTRPRKTLG